MTGRKLFLLAVRDSAMQAFAAPMCFPSMGLAQRTFRDEVNRKESQINLHPDDYELYMLGYFDEDSGILEPQRPECVARAKDLKE